MKGVEWFKEQILTGVFGAADRSAFDVKLLDTFAAASYLELDYEHEASNLERFSERLLPLLSDVYVPRCYRRATSRRVLATEWIVGEQLARSPPEVIRRLTAVGVDCFLVQLLQIGFFHSDPHPGNLLVDREGRLVLIDFGLCAEIAQFDSRGLTSAIVHLMRGDVPALVQDGIALGFLPDDVDVGALVPPLSAIFEKGRIAAASELSQGRFARGGGEGGGAEMTAVGKGTTVGKGTAQRRAQFTAISRELNQIFFEFPFTVPEYFALITRALIVLEGIALSGDKAHAQNLVTHTESRHPYKISSPILPCVTHSPHLSPILPICHAPLGKPHPSFRPPCPARTTFADATLVDATLVDATRFHQTSPTSLPCRILICSLKRIRMRRATPPSSSASRSSQGCLARPRAPQTHT